MLCLACGALGASLKAGGVTTPGSRALLSATSAKSVNCGKGPCGGFGGGQVRTMWMQSACRARSLSVMMLARPQALASNPLDEERGLSRRRDRRS